jgi:hypothetical protein
MQARSTLELKVNKQRSGTEGSICARTTDEDASPRGSHASKNRKIRSGKTKSCIRNPVMNTNTQTSKYTTTQLPFVNISTYLGFVNTNHLVFPLSQRPYFTVHQDSLGMSLSGHQPSTPKRKADSPPSEQSPSKKPRRPLLPLSSSTVSTSSEIIPAMRQSASPLAIISWIARTE